MVFYQCSLEALPLTSTVFELLAVTNETFVPRRCKWDLGASETPNDFVVKMTYLGLLLILYRGFVCSFDSFLVSSKSLLGSRYWMCDFGQQRESQVQNDFIFCMPDRGVLLVWGRSFLNSPIFHLLATFFWSKMADLQICLLRRIAGAKRGHHQNVKLWLPVSVPQ